MQSLVPQRFSSGFCSSITASITRVPRKSLFLEILRPIKSLSFSRPALQEHILDGTSWALWRLPRPKQTQGWSLKRSAQPNPCILNRCSLENLLERLVPLISGPQPSLVNPKPHTIRLQPEFEPAQKLEPKTCIVFPAPCCQVAPRTLKDAIG